MAKPLPRVFGLLAQENDPAVDFALIEALPHLNGEAREAALSLVCQRGRAGPIARLLSSWKGYEAPLRERIQRRFAELHPGVRTLLQSEKIEDRAAAISAVVAAQDCKSAYLLAETLKSRCPRTRELAAQGLRTLTEAHLAEREKGVDSQRAAEFLSCHDRLGAALSTVVKDWESHLHTGALEAALWMMEHVEEVLVEKLDAVPNKIGHALESYLKRPTDPRLAGFCLRALTFPSLRTAAIKALAQASEPKFVRAMASESWLLADPQLRRALRGLLLFTKPEQTVPDVNDDPVLMAGALRLNWVAGKRRDRLHQLVESMEGPRAQEWRRAVLWNLVEDETEPATTMLAAIASRAEDPRSTVAGREYKRRRARQTLAGGPVPETTPLSRALARFTDDQGTFTSQEFAELSHQLEALADESTKTLAQWLDSPSHPRKAETIRAVRALRWVGRLLPELHRCAHDADPLVRCAALQALAADKSPITLRLLREALNDPESRVQATAIEALEQLGVSTALQPIQGKMQSTHHRVRANAIKALWGVELRHAARELDKMLKDEAPEHRVSALWVVERIRFEPILDRIATMAGADPDARVRARAQRVLARSSSAKPAAGVSHAC